LRGAAIQWWTECLSHLGRLLAIGPGWQAGIAPLQAAARFLERRSAPQAAAPIGTGASADVAIASVNEGLAPGPTSRARAEIRWLKKACSEQLPPQWQRPGRYSAIELLAWQSGPDLRMAGRICQIFRYHNASCGKGDGATMPLARWMLSPAAYRFL
jgi:hypothetical protein